MSIQPHIHVAQVAPRVVVCGEPNRANRIASMLNNAELSLKTANTVYSMVSSKDNRSRYAAQGLVHHP